MKKNIDTIEKLAKQLSEIHSHSMLKFYSNKKSTFWDELEQKSKNKNEVDKEFFIRIAESIISSFDLTQK